MEDAATPVPTRTDHSNVAVCKDTLLMKIKVHVWISMNALLAMVDAVTLVATPMDHLTAVAQQDIYSGLMG